MHPKVPPSAVNTASAAQCRMWLLKALELLTNGTAECKMFAGAAYATGGTADVSCLHGVEIARKFLFESESTRDYVDIFRSMTVWPRLVVIDASCGVVTTMEGNHSEEARALWGDYHGTFKPFVKEKQIREGQLPDLSPVAIPDFERQAARRSAADPDWRPVAMARLRQAMKAKSPLERTKIPHPFQRGAHWQRVVASDRFHQSPYVLKRVIEKSKKKPHSHKRVSCTQHLLSICSSLREVRTSIMESLNARRKQYLSTVCTTDPVHHIVFTEKLRRWSNARIIQQQDETLAKSTKPGQVVTIDPVFGFAQVVCSVCKQGGHSAIQCKEDGEVSEPAKQGTSSECERGDEKEGFKRESDNQQASYCSEAPTAFAVEISVTEVGACDSTTRLQST
jgi:hypothetical protein